MDIESALVSAETVMKTKRPRTYAARDELADELDNAMQDAIQIATDLTDRVDAVTDLIEELRNADREDFADLIDNLKAAGEELRDLLR